MFLAVELNVGALGLGAGALGLGATGLGLEGLSRVRDVLVRIAIGNI